MVHALGALWALWPLAAPLPINGYVERDPRLVEPTGFSVLSPLVKS
jgi:hypothetical protein